MKPQDRVMKAVITSVESIKDTVDRNVIEAVKAGTLKIEPAVLPILLKIIKMSIDDGHQKSFNVVSKSIGAIFDGLPKVAPVSSKSESTSTKGKK